MMFVRSWPRVVCGAVVVALPLVGAAAGAQPSSVGGLMATVWDASGCGLPGAEVTITSTESAQSLTGVTDQDGSFFPRDPFPFGDYRFTVKASGVPDQTRDVRLAEAGTLGITFIMSADGQMHNRLEESVPKLIENLKGRCAKEAAYSLPRIGAAAVPALLEVLGDRAQPTIGGVVGAPRVRACEALGEMHAAAREAVPDLLAVVADPAEDEVLRWSAARAMGKIGLEPERVVPVLARALREHPHSSFRFYLVEALGDFGPAARSALPALRRAQKEEGGGGSFARAFERIEGIPPRRRAQHDAIQEAILRHQHKPDGRVWCVSEDVSDALLKRVSDLKVSRRSDDCEDPLPASPASVARAAPNGDGTFIVTLTDRSMWPRQRRLPTLGWIDWISDSKVVAFSGWTLYRLERRAGRWRIVRADHTVVL